MPLPRFQLFELEDLSWFPSAIRDLATDYLHFIQRRFDLHKPKVKLLRALEQSSQARVVDLCPGGGRADEWRRQSHVKWREQQRDHRREGAFPNLIPIGCRASTAHCSTSRPAGGREMSTWRLNGSVATLMVCSRLGQ
jgi:hypothetical protein